MKDFLQDEKVNSKSDLSLCADAYEVPSVMHYSSPLIYRTVLSSVMHTKLPAATIVLGLLSNKGYVIHVYFFLSDFRVHWADYIWS